MEPGSKTRVSDACLAFCGECRHLSLSIRGSHRCAKGHDLADSSDFLRCQDRSPFPKAEGRDQDMSE